MQVIRGLKNWPDAGATVVTIGNFDGAHLGHQAMFEATRQMADKTQLPATVISFEPLPHEYFSPEASGEQPRLQGFRDRICSVAAAEMDRLLLLRFDHELAQMPAAQFVEEILVNTVHATHIIIGDDFRFGYQRQGSFAALQELSARLNFTVEQSPTCLQDARRVSSTLVRKHLLAADLAGAAELLGRPYRISGRVIHGEKVGRQLGFPTANVALGKHNPALRGVFAVWATHTESGKRFPGVANLGERPTVGGRKLLLEVHALDESPDWYGAHLAVDFMGQLRAEKRFDSLDALKAQIALDANAARTMMQRL